MKRITLILALLLYAIANSSAYYDISGDGDIPLPPPTRPGDTATVAIASQSTSSVQLIFLKSSINTLVEVCTTEGVTIYENSGSVLTGNRLEIDTHNWNEGKYIIRVKMQENKDNVIVVDCK